MMSTRRTERAIVDPYNNSQIHNTITFTLSRKVCKITIVSTFGKNVINIIKLHLLFIPIHTTATLIQHPIHNNRFDVDCFCSNMRDKYFDILFHKWNLKYGIPVGTIHHIDKNANCCFTSVLIVQIWN